VCLLLVAVSAPALAQARRVVVIKLDGLAGEMVDRFVAQRNKHTGKSELPWIDHLFYKRGARLQNFYTRGLSLSVPSW
jgi:hypothetical protein